MPPSKSFATCRWNVIVDTCNGGDRDGVATLCNSERACSSSCCLTLGERVMVSVGV